jgi:hypothetical protein
MTILPVGTELFHADGQTDMTKLTVAFRNFASASKKGGLLEFLVLTPVLQRQLALLPCLGTNITKTGDTTPCLGTNITKAGGTTSLSWHQYYKGSWHYFLVLAPILQRQ